MFITMLQDSLGATGGATRPSGVHTSTRIGALTIDIQHGDLTKQETDAIVNSSDECFSLNGNFVMLHILTVLAMLNNVPETTEYSKDLY